MTHQSEISVEFLAVQAANDNISLLKADDYFFTYFNSKISNSEELTLLLNLKSIFNKVFQIQTDFLFNQSN